MNTWMIVGYLFICVAFPVAGYMAAASKPRPRPRPKPVEYEPPTVRYEPAEVEITELPVIDYEPVTEPLEQRPVEPGARTYPRRAWQQPQDTIQPTTEEQT